MLRILLFFFTLNALLLPISGYAMLSVSESVAPMMSDQSGSSTNTMSNMANVCHMPSPCLNCDMNNMDAACGLDCSAHCLGSAATISDVFHLSIHATINTEIITAFKYFYSRTLSPELRPPLA